MSNTLATLLRAKMRPELMEDRVFASTTDAAFCVHRALGSCHDRETYKNALIVELNSRQHAVQRHASYSVLYKQKVVGRYEPDIVVDEQVLIQVVSQGQLEENPRETLLRGLAAGPLKVGLVIHFGESELRFARLL